MNPKIYLYTAISLLILIGINGCSSSKESTQVQEPEQTESVNETAEEEFVPSGPCDVEGVPDVLFFCGSVLEPVEVGSETELVGLPEITIQIRDDTRFKIAESTTSIDGSFFIRSIEIQEGKEYFISLRGDGKRHSELIKYEFSEHSNMGIVISDDFVSFEGAEWDDKVRESGTRVPPRTEQ